MKKYYPVIILGVIAIIAIIVRVSQRPPQSVVVDLVTPVNVSSSQSTTANGKTVKTSSYPQVTATPVDTSQVTSSTDGSIRVTMPAKNARVLSPVRVAGEARGSWYFEGSFPVLITDANNAVIAETIVQAGGNWMTEKMVPFDVSVTFTKQVSGTRGHIILKKDNPSGLPQNDASLDIPIIFK